MTEEEWLLATDMTRMLEVIRDRAGARKLRLFQVTCCHRIWRFVTDPASRASVGLVERAADAPVDERELLALPYDWLTDDCGGPGPAERHAFMTAGHVGYSLFGPLHGSPFPADDWRDAVAAAEGAATTVAEAAGFPDGDEYMPAYQAHQAAERAVQADLLRDIFGNPFRPVTFSPEWLTSTVLTLAQVMYESRDFSAMPILADALEDAGCDSADILDHCRNAGQVHVRGCWVVDLVLGKS